jgi:prolyl 4-hydroxylase
MQQILVRGTGRPYIDGDSLDLSAPLVWTIAEVMTAAECADAIARIEQLGPSAAPITTHRGFEMRSDIRNNQRVMFDDPPLAKRLFARIRDAVPPALCGMHAVGANERFRCYRYTRGQRFAPHYDGAYVRSPEERSLLTLIIYLNDGFEGGQTAFYSFDRDLVVAPRTGSALVFQHLLLHEGCVVDAGVKYAMRSDVMYRA